MRFTLIHFYLFICFYFQTSQQEARKLKELELTNEALQHEIQKLERAKGETEKIVSKPFFSIQNYFIVTLQYTKGLDKSQ